MVKANVVTDEIKTTTYYDPNEATQGNVNKTTTPNWYHVTQEEMMDTDDKDRQNAEVINKAISGGQVDTTDSNETTTPDLYQNMADAGNKIKEKAVDVKEAAKDKAEDINKAATGLYQNVQEKMSDAGEKIKEKAGDVKEAAKDKAEDINKTAAGWYQEMQDKMTSAFEESKENIKGAKMAAEDKAEDINRKTSSQYREMQDKLSEVGDKAKDKAENAEAAVVQTFETAKDQLNDTNEQAKDQAESLGEKVTDAFVAAKDKVAEVAGKVWESLPALGTGEKEPEDKIWLRQKDDELKAQLAGTHSMGEKIQQALTDTKDYLVEVGEKVWEKMPSLSAGGEEQMETENKVTGDMQKLFEDAKEAAEDKSASVRNQMAEAYEDMKDDRQKIDRPQNMMNPY